MGEKESVIKKISKFKKALSRRLPIQKMILFGSYARGDYKKDSDIDLLVISSKFKNTPFIDRGTGFYILWHTGLKMGYPVDFLCYSPEEFEKQKKRISLVSMALKEGIEIN